MLNTPISMRGAMAFLLLMLMQCAPSNAQETACPAAPPMSPPWLAYPAQPFRHVLALPSGDVAAHVYVHDNGNGLERPFVFVEGIDFGLTGTEGPFQLGDFGWQAFHGCDADSYPMLGYMPAMMDSLLARGFQPVLVDFEQGAGDIFRNAKLLADILEHLREHRSDPRPMVVSGASMGGQIARLALAEMESSGSPHCTQLYLSLDSPHQGANVPLGLQQVIHALAEGADIIGGLPQALASPAARQLLLVQHLPGSLRQAYQTALDSLGWPVSCRTAGIANGSLAPMTNSTAPLLDYEYDILPTEVFGDISGILDIEIYPFPGNPAHPMATPFVPVTSWLEMPQGSGWPWPLQSNVGYGTGGADWSSWSLDHLPGGTRPSLLQFTLAFNEALESLDVPWPMNIPPIDSEEIVALHSFIPTPSALGIPPPWNGGQMDSLAMHSPFDAIHHGADNEPHSQINPANLSFVLNQLDMTECPLLPGDLNEEVVLNDTGDWDLPGLTVDGRLCLQSAEGTFGDGAAPLGSHGEFRLGPCSGVISILEEGQLELGGGSATAHLIVSAGATIFLRGQLILHPGSTMTLEPEAQLIIDGGILDQRSEAVFECLPGARVNTPSAALWTQQSDSRFQLDGTVSLDEGALWQHQMAPDAMIQTQAAAHLQLAEDSHWSLQSVLGDAHWKVEPNGKVYVAGTGAWEQHQVNILMMGASTWRGALGSGWVFNDCHWRGTASDTMAIEGPLQLTEHQSLSIRLEHSTGDFRVADALFTGGEISMREDRIRWMNAIFKQNPIHHAGLLSSPSHLIESCQFEDAPNALTLQGPGRIRIEDSEWTNNGIGLSCRHARCELACCRFHSNEVGTEMDRGLLIMCHEGGGGWNSFHYNDLHMSFELAPLACLQGGANHFGSHLTGWAAGTLDLGCQGGAVDWDITGQSWEWPLGWPQIQTGLWAYGLDGAENCPVSAVDLAPVEATECRATGKKLTE